MLVMGLNQSIEAEGLDRHSWFLPGVQNELIRNVSAVSSKIVLVLINAGCVDVAEFEADERVAAILWAGYGGMYGGAAIADVMFGAFRFVCVDFNFDAFLSQT